MESTSTVPGDATRDPAATTGEAPPSANSQIQPKKEILPPPPAMPVPVIPNPEPPPSFDFELPSLIVDEKIEALNAENLALKAGLFEKVRGFNLIYIVSARASSPPIMVA